MTLSVRLDPEAKAALKEIARRRGTSQSHLVRTAIADLIEREGSSLYSRVEDLIGCVDGKPSDLSADTGKRFRRLLESRAE